MSRVFIVELERKTQAVKNTWVAARTWQVDALFEDIEKLYGARFRPLGVSEIAALLLEEGVIERKSLNAPSTVVVTITPRDLDDGVLRLN